MNYHSISRSAEQSILAPLMRGVVRKYLDPNQGAWDWSWAGNGGYLARMIVDVDGDGTPEYFYSTTLTNQRSVLQWWVFRETSPEHLSQYADDLMVSSVWQAGEIPGVGLDTVSMPGREARRGQREEDWKADLVHFSFRFPHIESQTSEVSDNDANKAYEENISNQPKLEVILLSDFVAGKGEWKELKDWGEIGGRLFRKDDWEAARQNKEFTAATALAEIEKTEKSSARQPAAETKSAAHSGAEIQPVGNETASKPLDAPGSTGMILFALVVVAALAGVAFFVLRKTK